MTERPLISVIVPVYNVAQYIDKCLDSLVRQTYDNLEIILIDDGSTDESGSKCDEWAATDARVMTIHKQNGGQASARNRGLEIAAGEYIGYVDSDDYIDVTMYETLLRLIEQEDADIVKCRYSSVGGDHSAQETYTNQVYSLTGRSVCNKMLEPLSSTYPITVAVWNCLYKAEVAKKVMFQEGVYYEDVMYSYRVLWDLNKVVFYDKPLYFYVTRNGSTTNSELTSKHIRDAINSTSRLHDFYLTYGTEEEVSLLCSNNLSYILSIRYQCPLKLKAEHAALTRLIKQYNLGYKNLFQHDLKNWIRYIVYRYFDRCYRWLRTRGRN